MTAPVTAPGLNQFDAEAATPAQFPDRLCERLATLEESIATHVREQARNGDVAFAVSDGDENTGERTDISE